MKKVQPLSLPSNKRAPPWGVRDFRRLFDKKHKASEILFQNDEAVSINDLPFPKHQDKRKGHTVMAMHAKRDAEVDVLMQPECEPDVDKMA